MKLSSVLVLLALSAIAEGNMFAAAARGLYQPIILSIGAVFVALNEKAEPSDKGSFDWYKWFDEKAKEEPK